MADRKTPSAGRKKIRMIERKIKQLTNYDKNLKRGQRIIFARDIINGRIASVEMINKHQEARLRKMFDERVTRLR